MGFGRVYPNDHQETFCMTVLGLKLRAAPTPSPRCTARSRAPCGGASIPASLRTRCPSATSPTASTCRHGSRRRCAASTTAISAWTGRTAAATRAPGKPSRTSTTASSGRRTSASSRSFSTSCATAPCEQAERRGESHEIAATACARLSRPTRSPSASRAASPPTSAPTSSSPTSSASPRMVNDPKRPVQFVFAGKAHPHDEPGKRVLQQIAAMMRDTAIRRQVRLHRGLRHQRRPPPRPGRRRLAQQSAPAARSLRHQRTEGRAQRRPQSLGARWLVGRGLRRPQRLRHRQRPNPLQHGRARHAATAKISTASSRDEVIPLYYERDRDGLPRGWIKRMKRTIRTLGWRFNADRMVMDYTQKCYVPAAGGTSSDIRPLS